MAGRGLIAERAQFSNATWQTFDAYVGIVLALVRSRVREAFRLITKLKYRRNFIHSTDVKLGQAIALTLCRKMCFWTSPGTFCHNKHVYNYLHLHIAPFSCHSLYFY